MSDERIIVGGGPDVWRLTTRLRISRRYEDAREVKRLQQAWVNTVTGDEEWVDVPEVDETQ